MYRIFIKNLKQPNKSIQSQHKKVCGEKIEANLTFKQQITKRTA